MPPLELPIFQFFMIWRRFANYHASLKNDNIYYLTQRLSPTLCAINCERNKFVYLLYVAVTYLTYFVTSLASSTVGYVVNNLFYALCLLSQNHQIRSRVCCGRARCHLPVTKQLGKAKVSRTQKRTLTITLRYVYTSLAQGRSSTYGQWERWACTSLPLHFSEMPGLGEDKNGLTSRHVGSRLTSLTCHRITHPYRPYCPTRSILQKKL